MARPSFLGHCLLISCAVLLSSLSAFGTEVPSVDLYRPISEKISGRIEGLRWNDPPFRMTTMVIQGKTVPAVELSATFHKPGWGLVWRERELVESEDSQDPREVKFKVPVLAARTPVTLKAIGLHGKVEEETLVVVARLSSTGEATRIALLVPKRHYFSVFMGLTTIHYQETGISDFVESALTLKFAYQFLLVPRRWDIGGNIYYTLLPFNSSQSGTYLRYIGLNGRLGYVLPFIGEPWRVSIMAGGYFTSTYVTASQFGFKNMFGPQLFPVIQRSLGNGDMISFYFKFSPIVQGSSVSFKSREIASGASWSVGRRDAGGKSLSLSLDVSQLALNISPRLVIQSNIVVLGLGVGW